MTWCVTVRCHMVTSTVWSSWCCVGRAATSVQHLPEQTQREPGQFWALALSLDCVALLRQSLPCCQAKGQQEVGMGWRGIVCLRHGSPSGMVLILWCRVGQGKTGHWWAVVCAVTVCVNIGLHHGCVSRCAHHFCWWQLCASLCILPGPSVLL